MAAAGVKANSVPKAVSEYEYLNKKKSSKKGIHNLDDDEEEDTIPLKPFKPSHSSSKHSNIFSTLLSDDVNNSNAQSALRDSLTALRHDEIYFEPANSVPVPVNWSPIKPNPSLWLTPEKTASQQLGLNQQPSVSLCDSVLEPQDVNKLPLPSAWSPGMLIRPDPSLFVTPEKVQARPTPVIKDNFPTPSTDTKENWASTTTAEDRLLKEKHTVRFDLPPPVSSGEDTFESADFFMDERNPSSRSELISNNGSSPQYKVFSPPKVYNPCAYSDESALEDSFVNLNSNGSGKHLTSSSFQSENIPKTVGQKSTSKLSSSSSSMSRKVAKSKQRSSDSQAAIPQKGPQFIRSAYSQYDTNHPKSAVVRESKNKHISEDYSFPFGDSPSGEVESEHVFARPEYNSTLKVRAELDMLCQQEVDVEKALRQTLAKSETKRTEINEKASVYTNRASDQFGNLVNLEPSVNGLCSRIVRMRLSKAPKKKKPQQKKSSTKDDQAPDLQEFFTPDLQHDTPDLSMPGVVPITSKLITAPEDTAFDLYRHNRVWSGIKDL